MAYPTNTTTSPELRAQKPAFFRDFFDGITSYGAIKIEDCEIQFVLQVRGFFIVNF